MVVVHRMRSIRTHPLLY